MNLWSDFKNGSKIFTFIGAFLLNLHCSIPLYISNASVYVFSYAFATELPGAGISAEWLITSFSTCRTVGLFITGYVSSFIGTRLTLVLGTLLFSGPFFASYYSLDVSIQLFTVTFAAVPGLGAGVIWAISLRYLVSWDEENAGKVTSLVAVGFSIGAGLINIFITAYVNPDNVTPKETTDSSSSVSSKFFTDPQVIDKVPYVFMYLGISCFVIQFLGMLMISEKKTTTGRYTEMSSLREFGKSTNARNGASEGGGNEDGGKGEREDEGEDRRWRKQEGNETVHQELPVESNNSLCILEDNSSGSDEDMGPKELLRQPLFYKMTLIVGASQLGSIIFFQNYKLFGQNWIDDDNYLTSLAVAMSWLSIASRFSWGVAFDRLRTSDILFGYFALSSILYSWIYLSAVYNKWTFCVCVLGIGSTSAGHQVIFPPLALRCFGKKHFTTNYAVLMSSAIVVNFVQPEISKLILEASGYEFLFSYAVVCQVMTCIAIWTTWRSLK